jgi:hypothetical protein
MFQVTESLISKLPNYNVYDSYIHMNLFQKSEILHIQYHSHYTVRIFR